MAALGLFLRIECLVETSQEGHEEVRVFPHFFPAIAFDQNVDESSCLEFEIRIVSVVLHLFIVLLVFVNQEKH